MTALPSGTVTFLFTDVEGSTQMWERHRAEMAASLQVHDEILRAALEEKGGFVFSTMGDGCAASFARAEDAVAAARTAQGALADEPWPDSTPIRVRMGVHTGEAQERGGNYFGSALNRAARLMAAAHGGQVVLSDTAARVAGADGLRDLGEHRLKDLTAAERIWELVLDPDVVFPPLRTLRPLNHNLPIEATALVGRTAEIAGLVGIVQDRVLTTLVGIGGIGKTRLATSVAAQVAHRFQGGVWLVELARIGSTELVPQVVADALGLVQHPGKTVTESIADVLRDRQILLILDNCEHVLDAAGALASTLMASVPELRVLATSREALSIPGEQVFAVGSLDLADLDSASVDLFLERALEVRPDIDVADAEVRSLAADVCRQLDGIPLAIELAAARLGSMSLVDLEAHLDGMFRLLRGGRSRIERHQTLQASIDWSYEQLSDEERSLFEQLAVFVGGCTLAAVQRVCGRGLDHFDVLDLLAALVAKSMVRFEEADGQSRYRLLEPLRQYGQVKLAQAGRAVQARHRHLLYFTDFAEEIGRDLDSERQPAAARRLWPDFANIRTAHSFALAEGFVDGAVRIPVSLDLVRYQFMLYEIGDWAAAALALPAALEHELRFKLISSCSGTATDRGQLDLLRESADLAIGILGDADPPPYDFASIQGLRLVLDGDVEAGIDLVSGSMTSGRAESLWRAMMLTQFWHLLDAAEGIRISSWALSQAPPELSPGLAAILHGQRAVCFALLNDVDASMFEASRSLDQASKVPGCTFRNFPAIGEAAANVIAETPTDAVLQRTRLALAAWRDAGNRFQVIEHLAWVALLLSAKGATGDAASVARGVIASELFDQSPAFGTIMAKLRQLEGLSLPSKLSYPQDATDFAIRCIDRILDQAADPPR